MTGDDYWYDCSDADSYNCVSDDAISCKVIRRESLLAAQKDDLQRVMDLLSVKEHHARTLLIHYCWDVEKVLVVFIEQGIERLYVEGGVPVMGGNNHSSYNILSKISCEVCLEEFPAFKTTRMECGHVFCNECWTEHFIVKINDGHSRRITCMAHKCYSICNEENIRCLVSTRDKGLAEKFDRFLLESYIEDNKRVKWCPSVPHCGNAIRVENNECCEVECVCGFQFCFSCSSEAHSPCSCLMWKLWVKKCSVELENVTWIAENTKFCPKCYKPVEKNGGCNLVQCMCGQAFCWLCSGATGTEHTWNSIAGHECGRYKKEEEQNIELAKKQIWRYTHYYNRYKAHSDSLKDHESSLKEKLLEKITTLESRELSVKDYSWAWNGFHRVIRSRRIILLSYAFAYFMFGDELFKNEMSSKEKMIKQSLFEDQQQQLETNVERLSMFLEEQFAEDPEEMVLEIRMKIINLSVAIDNLCRKLYDCIDNDLLGSLQHAIHVIAPYKSTGAEKALELVE